MIHFPFQFYISCSFSATLSRVKQYFCQTSRWELTQNWLVVCWEDVIWCIVLFWKLKMSLKSSRLKNSELWCCFEWQDTLKAMVLLEAMSAPVIPQISHGIPCPSTVINMLISNEIWRGKSLILTKNRLLCHSLEQASNSPCVIMLTQHYNLSGHRGEIVMDHARHSDLFPHSS